MSIRICIRGLGPLIIHFLIISTIYRFETASFCATWMEKAFALPYDLELLELVAFGG